MNWHSNWIYFFGQYSVTFYKGTVGDLMLFGTLLLLIFKVSVKGTDLKIFLFYRLGTYQLSFSWWHRSYSKQWLCPLPSKLKMKKAAKNFSFGTGTKFFESTRAELETPQSSHQYWKLENCLPPAASVTPSIHKCSNFFLL